MISNLSNFPRGIYYAARLGKLRLTNVSLAYILCMFFYFLFFYFHYPFFAFSGSSFHRWDTMRALQKRHNTGWCQDGVSGNSRGFPETWLWLGHWSYGFQFDGNFSHTVSIFIYLLYIHIFKIQIYTPVSNSYASGDRTNWNIAGGCFTFRTGTIFLCSNLYVGT